jgi:hypothetical protein
MRAFVKLREIMATHDEQIHVIFDAIKKLLAPTVTPKRRIGCFRRNRRPASDGPFRGRLVLARRA